MKIIRVLQCDIGRYNMLSNEETLSFRMIIEEDGNLIKSGEAVSVINYSGDKEELNDFENAVENDDMQFLFDKCFSYSKRVFGSTPYGENCLLFAKLYLENFDELSENKSKKETKRIKEEIERLKKNLTNKYDIELPDFRPEIRKSITGEIEKYKKWIADNEKEISQYKDGVEKAEELKKKILSYKEKISGLTTLSEINEGINKLI